MMVSIEGFRIESLLHKGSNSIIHKAFDLKNEKPVIIKILNKELPTYEDIKLFEQEFELTKKLKSESVIEAYDFIRIERKIAIILEDFSALNLNELIESEHPDICERLEISIKVTKALEHLHNQGTIHKDINPSNILVNPESLVVKLIDFGISTQLQNEQQQYVSPNVLEGTLTYISPEQTGRMNRSIDKRSDLYSLGITLYEIFTEQAPFRSDDPLELVYSHIAKKPQHPKILCPELPTALANIILKLMEKDSDKRYQSAAGLWPDLELCYQHLINHEDIPDFQLGRFDIRDKFCISQKLYGRENDIDKMLNLFHRACRGFAQLLLVSGYSGIGKTSLVNEIHKQTIGKKRYFTTGKFGQYNKDLPYSGFIQCFKSLFRQILAEDLEQISQWKIELSAALGNNKEILTNIMPELELIIGKQETTETEQSKANLNRFRYALLNLIQVFTKDERPLVIFIDDLQWADLSSIKLLEFILQDPDQKNLFIIGAYRKNEVSHDHPLIQTIDRLKKGRGNIDEVYLNPLKKEQILALLMDTFLSSQVEAEPLAAIVKTKTDGNPFFINQLLTNFHQEKSIFFDYKTNRWQWNLDHIQNATVTENIVDFMMIKIKHLPVESQEMLKIGACLGHTFDLKTLGIIAECTPTLVANLLWKPLEERLIDPIDSKYKLVNDEHAEAIKFRFAHDRIQQAAHSMLTDEERQKTHLKIGRYFKQNSKDDTNFFDIIAHFNKGFNLISSDEEKLEIANLNIKAAHKANISAAYHAAEQFLQIAIKLLPEKPWKTCYEIYLSLHNELVETCYLLGKHTEVHRLCSEIMNNAKTSLDKAQVYVFQPLAYVAENKPQHAVKLGLEGIKSLRLINENLSKSKFTTFKSILKSRILWKRKNIDKLADLPKLESKEKIAAMKILARLSSACYFVDPGQLVINTCAQVCISIRHGLSPYTCKGFATYALIFGSKFDIESGYRFGKVALEILAKSARDSACEVNFIVNSFIRHAKEPLRNCIPHLEDTYNLGLETGEIEFAAHTLHSLSMLPFTYGENLGKIAANIEKYSNMITHKLHQGTSAEMNKPFWQSYLNLLGRNSDPTKLIGDVFNEDQMIPEFERNHHKTSLYMTYLMKTILSFYFHDYHNAARFAQLARQNHLFFGHPNHLMLNFFDSLIHCEIFSQTSDPKNKKTLLKRIEKNQKTLKRWAHHSSVNYLHRYELIQAELCRIQKDMNMAVAHYEKSIRSARESQFLHDEALANELFGLFWIKLNNQKLSDVFIKDAYHCYELWGADAKVKHLEKLFPYLVKKRSSNTTLELNKTISSGATVNAMIDTETVVKASQALSGQMDQDQLLKDLMALTMENAGAQLGFLLLWENDQPIVKLSGWVEDKVQVKVINSHLKEVKELPHSVINFVSKSLEPIVSQDAPHDHLFEADPYIQREKPNSLICFPILSQKKLIGVVYLENRSATGAFTPNMIKILSILSSQGAISILNARFVEEVRIKTALEGQLQAAQMVQEALLPNLTHSLQEISIEAHYESADQTGGDWYGYYLDESNQRLYIQIGDVTGHGIPSALMTGAVAGAISGVLRNWQYVNFSGNIDQCLEVLAKTVNQTVIEIGQRAQRFMTMAFLAIDLKSGHASYINAGHQPIYLIRDGEAKAFINPGSVLGFSPFEYSVKHFDFMPNDILFLFTDGLLENTGPQGEALKSKELRRILSTSHDISELKKIILEKKSNLWQAKPMDDDCTFVIIKRIPVAQALSA